ncbi:helix-turn-helix transcriptional regulator [Streptomyces violaceorubidus]|uniref:Helix-turn-helix transcriptional regulator n=1 Tax=Streptomyces violaceorubidus TaxID=284042 RepID=A0ABV1T0K2_9ACTN
MSQQGTDHTGPSAEAPQPARATDPTEYREALRALRTWSGLTYRQLEGKATAHGDSLPASTIATTLGRATLPGERFVDAFTRACGLTEDEGLQWLQARRRIAAGKAGPAEGPRPASGEDGDAGRSPDSGASSPPRAPRARRVIGLLVAGGVGALAALGIDRLLDDSPSPPAPPTRATTDLRMPAVGSWARIHPARTPDWCLTEGVDRTGRYESAVAAGRPCAGAALPRVFLEPLSNGTVQIQWHHPDHGIGCLTVLSEGPGRGLLEPRDDCADEDRAQQFRMESVGATASAHFRIRPAVTDQCLSLRDQGGESGAEITQARCSASGGQDFLIELIAPA